MATTTKFVGSLVRTTARVTRCITPRAVASYTSPLKLGCVFAVNPQVSLPQTHIQVERRCFLSTSGDKKVSEVEKAFTLSDDEFKAKYNMYKPNIMSERVVIYCRSGKRAHKVCEQLHKMGYEKIKRYPGGMTEWNDILFGQVEENKK
ncbi:hypothetical protein LSH36_885g00000 [Paralvinella palmiformis]|uniref:Rhodanese domain-containing protein n=1 Tax=Paralvinella palmiformis TaxID=53620 RepID=A0AAD9IYP9_9ANNE|nr:hypothetical protein LSH36_885g00000 [Paralvinella palmiformis]